MKRSKKLVSLMLAAATASMALAGCGSKSADTTATTAGGGVATEAQTEAGTKEAAAEFSYPMASGNKLTYWCELTSTVAAIRRWARRSSSLD